MSTRTQTCEQRIGNELASTEKWLTEKYAEMADLQKKDRDEEADAIYEEIAPYSVTTRVHMRLELAGGGPAAWIDAELDKGGHAHEVVSVTYHFADWFDHAERKVSQSEAPGLWRMAEYYAEYAGGSPN